MSIREIDHKPEEGSIPSETVEIWIVSS